MHTPFPFKHILIHIHDVRAADNRLYRRQRERYCISPLDKCSPALHFSQRQKTITHQHQSSRYQGMTENVISEEVNVALSELIQRDSSTEGKEALLKQKANIDIFKGKL